MSKSPVSLPLSTPISKQKFPGLTALTGLPVIETREQAEVAGIELAIQQLVKTEYIADTDSVEVTATGWNMVFNVYGD